MKLGRNFEIILPPIFHIEVAMHCNRYEIIQLCAHKPQIGRSLVNRGRAYQEWTQCIVQRCLEYGGKRRFYRYEIIQRVLVNLKYNMM
jgi:hypothetical protein